MRESISAKSVLKQIKSLSEFKVPTNEVAPLYHPPVQVPQFLQHNLTSPNRVIRQFTGELAVVRAFYFSLMRLSLQLQNQEEDYAQMVRRKLVQEQQFEIGQFEDANFTDRQYRTFIKQFMEEVSKSVPPSFEDMIQCYPVVDQMLMTLFKKMVPVPFLMPDIEQYQIGKRILKYLCEKFNMTLEEISGCFKMEQPDMFLYLLNSKKVYLIYQNPTQTPDASSMSSNDLSISQIASRTVDGSRRSIVTSRQSTTSRKSISFSKLVSNLGEDSQINMQCFEKAHEAGRRVPKDSILSNKVSKFTKKEAKEEYYPTVSRQTGNNMQKQNRQLRRISQHRPQYQDGQSSISNPLSHSRSNPSILTSRLQQEKNKAEQYQPLLQQKEKTSNVSSGHVRQSSNTGQEHLSLFSKLESNIGSNSNISNNIKPKEISRYVQSNDDSGIAKFTDSGLLEMLDDNYRDQVKTIKKRYRETRHTIRQFI